MKNKVDKRVSRSKKDLKNTFIELLNKNEDISKVSVTEITNQANYNRTTFYAHFVNKEALLEEIMEDAVDGFISAFRDPYKYNKTLYIKTLPSQSVKIFKYVESHKSMFALLFNPKIFPGFQQDLAYAISEVFNELVFDEVETNKLDKKLYNKIEAWSIVGMMDHWIQEDFAVSAEYMTEQLLLKTKYKPLIVKKNREDI